MPRRVRYHVDTQVARQDSLLHIPESMVDFEQVHADLTVVNGAFWAAANAGLPTGNLESELELYRHENGVISVPRHYDPPWVVPKRERLILHKRQRDGRGLPSDIRLRDHIQERATAALLEDTDDKILALSCGKGKTVISLHAAMVGERLPLLVVVHTNALMDQWRERIRQFVGFGKVGHVQADIFDYQKCNCCVAMLHSLCLKRYPPEFYNHWRLVIFDEVHRLGAQLFQRAASLFPAERWGLSATHEREDRMDKVFKLHLGRVCYENLTQDLVPKVYFVQTDTWLDINRFTFRRGRVNLSRLTTYISDLEPRNQLIQHWVSRAVRDSRTVLVLGERLTQLHDLYEGCDVSSKSLHVGAMNQEERAEALRCQVVFATQQLAKEGLDRPAFDTLFILSPFGGEGRLRQTIGRILRTLDGKKEPRVLIFEDVQIGIMRGLCRKMRRHLTKMGFQAKTVKVKRNK